MRHIVHKHGKLVTLSAIMTIGLCFANSGLAATSPLAYVLLTEKGHAMKGDTIPLLRLVLPHADGYSDASCAALTMSNSSGNTVHLISRANPDPVEMPVTVCEGVFPFAKKYQPKGETWTIDGISKASMTVQLPTVNLNLDNALLIGDTGCRGMDKGKMAQDCTNDWPFPNTLAHDMANYLTDKDKPTVIVHVGDYKYRGKTDPDLKTGDNGLPLKWSNWQADFFNPMSGVDGGPNLFAMAPWVVTRGNHELCDSMGNNGKGWFFLLDTTSTVVGDSPEMVEKASCTGVSDTIDSPPYRMDFANGLSMVMVDSAGLNETADVCDLQAKTLNGFFQQIDTSFKGSNQQAWLVTHRPIWVGMGKCSDATLSNPTPQAALETLPQQTLPSAIKLTLVGHRHYYTSMDINTKDKSRRTLELILGNGGVQLNNKAYSGCISQNAGKTALSFQADAHGMSRHGFITASFDSGKNSLKGWKLNSMALTNAAAPWGTLTKAESCVYPVKKGESACKIADDKLFSTACKSCETAPGLDGAKHDCAKDTEVDTEMN